LQLSRCQIGKMYRDLKKKHKLGSTQSETGRTQTYKFENPDVLNANDSDAESILNSNRFRNKEEDMNGSVYSFSN